MTTEQNNGACSPSFSSAGLERFESWWQAHGQYCRAGGGEYEKTFAFRAWEAAEQSEREACAKVCEALRDEWAKLKVGATDGRYELMEEAATVCEDEIRTRSNIQVEGAAASSACKAPSPTEG